MLTMELSMETRPLETPELPFRQDLYREINCAVCARRYGIFGPALFCPDCGVGGLRDHFLRERGLLGALLDDADAAEAAGRREAALRRYGNAHEDVTTTLEAYLKLIYRNVMRARHGASAQKAIASVGNDFQNVDRARKRFSPLGVDPFSALSANTLTTLETDLEARHVVTHNLGIVDARHAGKVGSAAPGTAVLIKRADVERFFGAVEAVVRCAALAAPELRTYWPA